MRRSEREAPENTYAVSDFTGELVEEVVRGNYSLEAWQSLLSRSWARSLEDIREVPDRTRSCLRWAVVGAGIGTGLLFLALAFHGLREMVRTAALWLPWYVGVVLFMLTHLGMVDDSESGRPHASLLSPNVSSFMRLGLAPLVFWPCLSLPTHPSTGPIYASFLALLALTDVLDGWLARRLRAATRMGRMLDPLADLSFLTFLAIGLLAAGLLPKPLFILLVLRYPGTLVAVLVLYFTRGPVPLRPSVIGKASSLVTNVVLVAIAVEELLQPPWLPEPWIAWSVRALYVLLGANLLYLFYQAVTWEGGRVGHGRGRE